LNKTTTRNVTTVNSRGARNSRPGRMQFCIAVSWFLNVLQFFSAAALSYMNA